MKTFDHTSGKHLDSDGARIYYEVSGDAGSPVLLFLHGGFGNIEDFNAVLPELEGTYRVIGIDSRGQGKSTIGPNGVSYAQIQKDVERILAHLGINTLSILGFSDGGIVAYRLASKTKLKIEKLIAIDSEWHAKYKESIRDILSNVTGESWRKKFPDTYEAYQKWNPEPDFDRLAPALVKMWLDTGPTGYPNDAVEKIICPTLIVRGDKDHLVSRESVFELVGRIKDAQLLHIPLAGHVAYVDQKEVFLTILNQFLEDQPACG